MQLLKVMSLLFGLILPFLLLSQNKGDIKFQISGNIEGLGNDSLVLFINNFDLAGNNRKTDTLSTVAKNNIFSISEIVSNPTIVWASAGGIKSRKNFTFFIEEGNVNIEGSIDSLDSLSITGTPSNEDQTEAKKITGKIYYRIRELRKLLKNTKEDSEEFKKLSNIIVTWLDSIHLFEIEFIKSHPNSLLSGTYLYVKQDKLELTELEALYNDLENKIKSSGFGIIVKQKIVARKRVTIGNKAPEFQAKDTSGNIVKLTDFKGQYVLLEFWAHWCVPCRKEHPHLKDVFKKYNSKGFTILQYSMDDRKAAEKWKDAIKTDQLSWTQVSELDGFASSVSKLYGVQPIPDNFLIDPSGIIIGRRLRGSDLENKLAEIFK